MRSRGRICVRSSSSAARRSNLSSENCTSRRKTQLGQAVGAAGGAIEKAFGLAQEIFQLFGSQWRKAGAAGGMVEEEDRHDDASVRVHRIPRRDAQLLGVDAKAPHQGFSDGDRQRKCRGLVRASKDLEFEDIGFDLMAKPGRNRRMALVVSGPWQNPSRLSFPVSISG